MAKIHRKGIIREESAFPAGAVGICGIYPDPYNVAMACRHIPQGEPVPNSGRETYYRQSAPFPQNLTRMQQRSIMKPAFWNGVAI